MRIDVETKLLFGVVQYLVLPPEKIVDRFPPVVLSDPVAQDHARRAIAEQQDPYPDLLVLMYGLQLGPGQDARDLTREDQYPRRLLLERRPEREVGGRPQRGETAGAADAVQQHLLHALADPELFHDVVVEARVGGIGTRRRDHVRDLVQAAAPLGDRFAARRDRERDPILQEHLTEIGDCGRFRLVDDRVIDGTD